VPIDEKHPLNPRSPYGASKLATESLGFAYHQTYGLPFVVLGFLIHMVKDNPGM